MVAIANGIENKRIDIPSVLRRMVLSNCSFFTLSIKFYCFHIRGDGEMENIKIKRYFDKKNENTQRILINILEDSLLCLYNQELIEDVTLNRVISFYFLLREYKYDKMIEFEEFSIEEKKIIFKMIMEGIASVYVDNEYLESSDRGTKYKQIIIGELLSFFI